MTILKNVSEPIGELEEKESQPRRNKYADLEKAIICDDDKMSPEEYARLAGLRIAQIRKLRGLNQSELAEEAGLMVNTISNLERGSNPQLNTLVKISNYLDVPLHELLDLKTDNYMKYIKNDALTKMGLKGSLMAAADISNDLNSLSPEQLAVISVQVSALAKMNQGNA